MRRAHRLRAIAASRALGSLISLAAVGRAQDSPAPINTDRPGFLFSPYLVPPGRAQFELGIPTLTSFCDGDVKLTSAFAQFRYGLSEPIELRVASSMWNELDIDGAPDEDGVGDTEIGAKLALATGDFPMALIVGLRLPTGDDAFTTDELGGSANLAVGRDIGSGWWFQGLAGITYAPVKDGDDALTGALAALFSHAIGEGWSAYGEASIFPGLDDAAGQSFAGVGLVWAIDPRWQADISADFGLDDDAADAVSALGLSCYL